MGNFIDIYQWTINNGQWTNLSAEDVFIEFSSSNRAVNVRPYARCGVSPLEQLSNHARIFLYEHCSLFTVYCSLLWLKRSYLYLPKSSLRQACRLYGAAEFLA